MSAKKTLSVLALLLLAGCDEFKGEMSAAEQRTAIEACHRAGLSAYPNFGYGLSFAHAKVVSYSCRPREDKGDAS